MTHAEIGVIGGTGLYDFRELAHAKHVEIDTPFGAPSSPIVLAQVEDRQVAFLARHGDGHRLFPHDLPARANIFALKSLGVNAIFGISAVGSLREEIHPGDVIIVDQFLDQTRTRPRTFFGDGVIAHVAFADPVCASLGDALEESAKALLVRAHRGGTYVCIEGPQFSTRAESESFRALRASVVGMTALPEARLSREAEICYATLALVTDYDCWHPHEGAVTADAVMAILAKNSETARRIVLRAIVRADRARACPCRTALDAALITDRARIPGAMRERLRPILERVLATS